ncbi:hypothetical protein SISNIDRAFT_486297 [Sistotremastrum niveocremeum HHB9708]|uniref:BHLH domain-containing protein n=1 Tax=Sistotremastrum niveocremeum HHB9708 TaxID=1314777 RepID=A0A164U0C2_9AGAM|nr:hypothetical protein SISNIDRAFT_486297 [Sistotremastrum niveocremeum HHB9708]
MSAQLGGSLMLRGKAPGPKRTARSTYQPNHNIPYSNATIPSISHDTNSPLTEFSITDSPYTELYSNSRAQGAESLTIHTAHLPVSMVSWGNVTNNEIISAFPQSFEEMPETFLQGPTLETSLQFERPCHQQPPPYTTNVHDGQEPEIRLSPSAESSLLETPSDEYSEALALPRRAVASPRTPNSSTHPPYPYGYSRAMLSSPSDEYYPPSPMTSPYILSPMHEKNQPLRKDRRRVIEKRSKEKRKTALTKLRESLRLYQLQPVPEADVLEQAADLLRQLAPAAP